jgi:hypothetical protein
MYSSKKSHFHSQQSNKRQKRENYEAMKIYYHPNLIVRSLTTKKMAMKMQWMYNFLQFLSNSDALNKFALSNFYSHILLWYGN